MEELEKILETAAENFSHKLTEVAVEVHQATEGLTVQDALSTAGEFVLEVTDLLTD
ncbi:MAG: hypothetical protein NTW74_05565 [Acidobacteria bacterium]|nr:hypothetical protein [Acidobacteriota bacterium]